MNKHHQLRLDPRTGKYYTRIQRDGVMRRLSFAGNRREADAELLKTEAEIASGKVGFSKTSSATVTNGIKDIRLEELIHEHLEWLKSNRAPSTYETRVYYLKPFYEFTGECMVSSLTRMMIEKYFAWVKKNHGHSENGGNNHLRHVKSLLHWGEDMCFCDNPVKKFPPIHEMPAKTKKFSNDELRILLNRLPPQSTEFKDLITVGCLTGLRPQELRALSSDHIRVDGNGVWAAVFERHKTSGSARNPASRTVPLSSNALAIINRQLASHPKSKVIFLNDDKKPYTAVGLRQKMQRWCRRAGIPEKSPYAMRHFYGTSLAGQGTNQSVMAQMMGHTTIRTTTRYVANVPEYHQKAVENLEKSLAFLTEAPSEGSMEATKVVPEVVPAILCPKHSEGQKA